MLNNLLQIQLKLLQKEQFKNAAEARGDLIGNKIADKITKVSRRSPQNSSEKVESETVNIRFDKEIPKEIYIYIYIYISSDKRQNLLMIQH